MPLLCGGLSRKEVHNIAKLQNRLRAGGTLPLQNGTLRPWNTGLMPQVSVIYLPSQHLEHQQ